MAKQIQAFAVRKLAEGGLQIVNSGTRGQTDPPKQVRLPASFIANCRREGWVEVEGAKTVYVPASPETAPDPLPPHTFVQLDSVTFKTVDGEVRYRVVHNPGKYDSKGKPTETFDSSHEVHHYYDLERES